MRICRLLSMLRFGLLGLLLALSGLASAEVKISQLSYLDRGFMDQQIDPLGVLSHVLVGLRVTGPHHTQSIPFQFEADGPINDMKCREVCDFDPIFIIGNAWIFEIIKFGNIQLITIIDWTRGGKAVPVPFRQCFEPSTDIGFSTEFRCHA